LPYGRPITILRGGKVMEKATAGAVAAIASLQRQLAAGLDHVPARPAIELRMRKALLQVDVSRIWRPAAVAVQAGPAIHAVDGVSFSIRPGQSTALVGRSGCGKVDTGAHEPRSTGRHRAAYFSSARR
jgi:peptide/nickel transport system ATP-binding protein